MKAVILCRSGLNAVSGCGCMLCTRCRCDETGRFVPVRICHCRESTPHALYSMTHDSIACKPLSAGSMTVILSSICSAVSVCKSLRASETSIKGREPMDLRSSRAEQLLGSLHEGKPRLSERGGLRRGRARTDASVSRKCLNPPRRFFPNPFLMSPTTPGTPPARLASPHNA